MRKLRAAHSILSSVSAALLLVTLVACTSADSHHSPSTLPEPSTNESASAPSDTPGISDWAAERVPAPGADGYIAASSGSISESSGQSSFLELSSLAPGNYSYFVVCSGGGDASFVIDSAGTDPVTFTGTCTDESQGGDFSTATTGATITGTFSAPLTGNSAASWAVAVTELLPR